MRLRKPLRTGFIWCTRLCEVVKDTTLRLRKIERYRPQPYSAMTGSLSLRKWERINSAACEGLRGVQLDINGASTLFISVADLSAFDGSLCDLVVVLALVLSLSC